MIKSIKFENFRVLRNTELPLGRFTLIVGPNGSGKSTVFQALRAVADPVEFSLDRLVWVGARATNSGVAVHIEWGGKRSGATSSASWKPGPIIVRHTSDGRNTDPAVSEELRAALSSIRVYSFQGSAIAAHVGLRPKQELGSDGGKLAGVLDRLRDNEPERFEQLNREMARWLPEFDRILFQTPGPGKRAFELRVLGVQASIRAQDLSHGTLLALAMLTLAYLPSPPPVVCLEEPDRGLHPRLLRDVRDAMYRLAYPEQYGDERPPTQVIATTHSPYMVDLFREHLDEIVIANKKGNEATFERLSDRPDVEEILGDCSLGDAWYTGVLGGVPSER